VRIRTLITATIALAGSVAAIIAWRRTNTPPADCGAADLGRRAVTHTRVGGRRRRGTRARCHQHEALAYERRGYWPVGRGRFALPPS
jgi:hypothetical protein